jgi:CubicO group peptidase (beta-lactamase class C family)
VDNALPDRRFALAHSVLAAGIAARAFPAAAIEVGRSSGPLWRESVGRLTYDSDASPASTETIFDLASLTKVIATTSLTLRGVASGHLSIDQAVGDFLPAWRDERHAGLTIRHLLTHSSGLPAHIRFWETCRGRGDFEEAIWSAPLEAPPGQVSVYSDPGFILLGFILEDIGGPLDQQVDVLANQIGLERLQYRPPADWSPEIAPTEFDVWRNRLLIGEVHDENAAALGGVAGHAGLFGSVRDVGAFACQMLVSFSSDTALAPAHLARAFATRSLVPASSRALGWDTMLPTSSCGTRLSHRAIGHTGFTGTSMWIDPELDLYVVLLTNRVHPTRDNDAIRSIRPRVHDAVVEGLRAVNSA